MGTAHAAAPAACGSRVRIAPVTVNAIELRFPRAREGAAIIISSHLLHLLEEVCSHVLILKRGKKIAHGTLDEIRAEFRNGEKESSLEEIFIRLVGEDAGK